MNSEEKTNKIQTTAYIDQELNNDFKVWLIRHNMSFTQWINKKIKEELQQTA